MSKRSIKTKSMKLPMMPRRLPSGNYPAIEASRALLARRIAHEQNIRRSFTPSILRKAQALASKYSVVMWQEGEVYCARGFELPGAMGDGKSPARCMNSVRESMMTLIAFMLERGEKPPSRIVNISI